MNTSTSLTEKIYGSLGQLRDQLPRLDEALIPGTPRRWTERDLTDTERARQNAAAAEDREAKARHGFTALSNARAPLRVDVLDTITTIAAGITAVEIDVCEALGLTPLAGATPHQRLTRLASLVNRIGDDDDLAVMVADETGRLQRHARRALGDSEPVYKIRARCPICDAMSLRSFVERELVICCNDDCRCADPDCACNADRPRRHRWVFADWAWLAQVLSQDLAS